MSFVSEDTRLLAEIGKKLDRLIGMMAIQGKAQDEQVRILAGLGFDAPSIGSLVGISANAVRIRKSRERSQTSLSRRVS